VSERVQVALQRIHLNTNEQISRESRSSEDDGNANILACLVTIVLVVIMSVPFRCRFNRKQNAYAQITRFVSQTAPPRLGTHREQA
jgi:hypothetical protein